VGHANVGCEIRIDNRKWPADINRSVTPSGLRRKLKSISVQFHYISIQFKFQLQLNDKLHVIPMDLAMVFKISRPGVHFGRLLYPTWALA